MRTGRQRGFLAAAGAVALAAILAGSPVEAAPQARGDSPSSRKQQAIEMCSRELDRREGGKGVYVERLIRNDHRDDKVHLDAYMRVRREGTDRQRRVDCVVNFSGNNRITHFEVDGSDGGGSGSGGGDSASRACWSAAEQAGYKVSKVIDTARVEGWGRAILMRSGVNDEVLCLYGSSVRGIYYRRR